MNKSNEIILLHRLSEMISFAEYLSIDVVSRRNTQPVYPVTIGELLVNYTLDPLLHHEWESAEYEAKADPLFDCLQELDMGVDRPDVWKELFAANVELKKFLN